MKYSLHDYQLQAIEFLSAHPRSALFVDMGMGKTAIMLKTLEKLMFDQCVVHKPLVIAPLQVAYNVWPEEVKTWVPYMPCKVFHNRTRKIKAFETHAGGLYVTNYDTLPWMAKNNVYDFDCVIFDESTFVKNRDTRRFQYVLKMFGDLRYIYLLTGTPAPNSLMDLWGQVFLLDNGRRLGYTITDYRNRYFLLNPYTHRWVPRKGALPKILESVKDLTFTLRREDWGSVPDVEYNEIKVTLPPEAMKIYKQLENEFVVELNKSKVTAFNAAALGVKLRQAAQGFFLTENGTEELHTAKIDMLKDLVAARPNESFLIGINFRHEADLIKNAIGGEVIYGGTPQKERQRIIKAWDNGLKILIAHPASLGHGVNLQKGGNNLIWFGPPWSLEHWKQFNARLDRQGQKNKVCISTLVARGTKDIHVAKALKAKNATHLTLMEALKR